jgi:aminoglycoside phosphotransferase
MDPEPEHRLTGGWVTSGVVRVGQTARRPRSLNAPFVERLLRHLEDAGFESAPRHLGFDEQGREILSFIEGDVPSDCRTTVWRDEQLTAIAELLRRFHDATSGSELAAGAEVVCHHDFGPWNLVWRDSLPIGIIDYDKAAPGTRLDDLGYAVWKALNLGLIDAPVLEQRRRMMVFTAAYGAIPDSTLLAAIEQAQERMRELIAAAPVGTDRDDALDQNRRERIWLEANGLRLVA